jgi:transcriptional regulator with XRE-family HTH domain
MSSRRYAFGEYVIQRNPVKLPVPGVMPYATLVGKVIEERRLAMRLTQADMAAVLEIGQSAYSRLEAGQAAMTLPQLRKLSVVLGLEPHAVLQVADAYARQVQALGVEVPADKVDNQVDKGALLIGLGLLVALMAK